MTRHVDFVIIGGGAAAFAAAIRADDHGAKTALIKPRPAARWHLRQRGLPGLRFDTREFDFAKIVGHEHAMVDQLRREKYERVIAGLPHVEVIAKRARFVTPTRSCSPRERPRIRPISGWERSASRSTTVWPSRSHPIFERRSQASV